MTPVQSTARCENIIYGYDLPECKTASRLWQEVQSHGHHNVAKVITCFERCHVTDYPNALKDIEPCFKACLKK